MFVSKNPFFIRAVHDAKIMEIVKRYEDKGYVTAREAKVEGQIFDVLFSHPQTKHQVAIEVLVRRDHKWQNGHSSEKTQKMREIADRQRLDFRLVPVVMPSRGDIKISWLTHAFQAYVKANPSLIRSDILPEPNIQQIDDIGIQSFAVDDDRAEVKGKGLIIIDHPDNYEIELPFEGSFKLDMQNKRIQNADIVFDYSYV